MFLIFIYIYGGLKVFVLTCYYDFSMFKKGCGSRNTVFSKEQGPETPTFYLTS